MILLLELEFQKCIKLLWNPQQNFILVPSLSL